VEEACSKVFVILAQHFQKKWLPVLQPATLAGFSIAASLPVQLAGFLKRWAVWLDCAMLQTPDFGADSGADKTPTIWKLATLAGRTELGFEIVDQVG
jgi:hypothetical protein